MSLKIRLSRFGKKNAPTYKVVVCESTEKRNGRFTDIIGYFNPLGKTPEISIDKEKLEYWKSNGAKTTTAVDKLIEGTYNYQEYSPHKKKQETKEDAPEEMVEEQKEE